MIVADASAMFEVLALRSAAESVFRRMIEAELRIHAPHLLDIELLHVLRRSYRLGEVTTHRANRAMEDLSTLPITRHPHQDLSVRIWELRDNLSAYDAAYVALAERLGCPLITCDRALARSPGHRARVELY